MNASLKIMADAIFESSFVKRKIKKDGREQNDGVMGGVPQVRSTSFGGGGETQPESLVHCVDFFFL